MRGKLLGAGGDGIDTELLTASPDEVLDGQIFYGEGSEEMQTGTMPDRPAVDTAPGIVGLEDLLKVYLYRGGHIRNGESGYPEVNIPYTDLVNAINLAAEVIQNRVTIAGVTGTYGHDGNLTPETLVAGRIGYGADGRVAGEAVDRGVVNKTLNAGETYNVAKGFYADGQVKAANLASQTPGNARENHILNGYAAWADGNKYNGNIPSKGESTYVADGNNREIAAGQYLSGKQIIKGVKVAGLNAGTILQGTTVKIGDDANDRRIAEVAGTIPKKGAATYDTSASDQTIGAGQYLNGAQTIRGVTVKQSVQQRNPRTHQIEEVITDLVASSIKRGVKVRIGDAANDVRIASVEGTYEPSQYVTGRFFYGYLGTENWGDPVIDYFNSQNIVQQARIGANTVFRIMWKGNRISTLMFAIIVDNYEWYVMVYDTSVQSLSFHVNDYEYMEAGNQTVY